MKEYYLKVANKLSKGSPCICRCYQFPFWLYPLPLVLSFLISKSSITTKCALLLSNLQRDVRLVLNLLDHTLYHWNEKISRNFHNKILYNKITFHTIDCVLFIKGGSKPKSRRMRTKIFYNTKVTNLHAFVDGFPRNENLAAWYYALNNCLYLI